MNQKYVKDRYVDLSVISYGDYMNFNSGNTGGGGNFGGQQGSYVKLFNLVNEDNIPRSLVMRGLPYRVTADVVQGFFSEITKLSENSIHIEEFNGKRSGAALVEFESEEQAQAAKSSL